MKGKVLDNAGSHVKKLSNQEVLRHWQLAPTQIEYQVIRAKWLQAWVRHPRNHAQEVAAVLGSLFIESFCNSRST